MRTKPLIEQHFHGAFGINFNTATVDEILYLSKEIKKLGIGGIFPTIVTDTVENTYNAIQTIKKASMNQDNSMAKILGVHLEGIFLNPSKKGIHNSDLFLELTADNFKKFYDDIIKIVTLAPEMDEGLIDYLLSKNIKVQAGHCEGSDLSKCSGTTHTFNAMKGISHRDGSTALSALINDNIYTEIIADGIHVSDEALKLLFLVSDCLPCTQSNLSEFIFAGKKIYYDSIKAVSSDGTLAGSTTLLNFIIKRLNNINLFDTCLIKNPYEYHNCDLEGYVDWDDNFNLVNYVY